MAFRPLVLSLLALATMPAAVRAATPAAAAAPLTPIAAFAEEITYSTPRIAPDGRHLAVNVRMKRGERTIPTLTIYTLPERKIVSTIALPGFEIPVDFQWISNDRLIVMKGQEAGARERPEATGEIVALNIDGSKQEYLYGYNAFRQSSRGDRYGDDYGWGEVEHIPQSRNGHVFVSGHLWESMHSMLYDINTSNSTRKLLADIPMKDASFTFQNDAKPRFAHAYDDDNEHVLYKLDDASGAWQKMDLKPFGGSLFPFGFAPGDRAFYAWFAKDNGPYEVVEVDMATLKMRSIASDPQASIERVEFTSRPAVPLGVGAVIGVPTIRYLDDKLPDVALHKSLSAAFPGASVHFVNFSDDGQKALFQVISDRDPGSYYLFDRKVGKAELLFSNMELIDAEAMAPRLPVNFVNRDGIAITGYLTLPDNPTKTRLPMVLLPHGGPFSSRDEWQFDDDAQFLASRGYAVLQVNFRGSSGQGRKFIESGYREWGGKLLNDLIDGVKWASARPDIDAGRVCVFGISYGGYAALMLPVREPAMFRCAVGYSGRYDLITKYDQEGIKGDARSTNYVKKTLGDNEATLRENSPVTYADRIKIPVLMVHGGKDKTTLLSQAENMRAALTKAGNTPEWMYVKVEGHGFYDVGYRRDFYEKLAQFLEKNDAPR
jgi:dienelactone hydrolase